MNRATPTPMLSDDGGSPCTKPKIAVGPDGQSVLAVRGLDDLEGRGDLLGGQVAERLALEQHCGVGDPSVRAETPTWPKCGHRTRASGGRAAAADCPAADWLRAAEPRGGHCAPSGLPNGDRTHETPGNVRDLRQHGRHGAGRGRVRRLARAGLPDDLAFKPRPGAGASRQVLEQVLRGRRLRVGQVEVVVVVALELGEERRRSRRSTAARRPARTKGVGPPTARSVSWGTSRGRACAVVDSTGGR